MSYGVWRRKGKGFAYLEIDSPWNETIYDRWCDPDRATPHVAYTFLKHKFSEYDIEVDDYDNPDKLKWLAGQLDRHTDGKGQLTRHILHCRPGGGEHEGWLAVDDDLAYWRFINKDLEYGWDLMKETPKTIETLTNLKEYTIRKFQESMHYLYVKGEHVLRGHTGYGKVQDKESLADSMISFWNDVPSNLGSSCKII